MMRPYRLIGCSELHDLTHYFREIIEQWNSDYALNPWSILLDAPTQVNLVSEQLAIKTGDRIVALIDQNHVQAFNQVLFGQNNSAFDATSQELMLGLLSKLVKAQCSLSKEADRPDWFYKGSTCLSLTLSTEDKRINIILNPQCIYDLLPLNTKVKKLSSVDDALEKQTLKLALELASFKLSLSELSTIQVGDVITTDHPTNTPCRLTHEKQVLALADLGQSSVHKSIILKRFS